MPSIHAKVHRSKDNRLILIPLTGEGDQTTMSRALKEAGYENGDIIEFRRSKDTQLAEAAKVAAPKYRTRVVAHA